MLTSCRPVEAKPRSARVMSRSFGADRGPRASVPHPPGSAGQRPHKGACRGCWTRGLAPEAGAKSGPRHASRSRPAGKYGLMPKPVAQFGSLSPPKTKTGAQERRRQRPGRTVRAAAASGRLGGGGTARRASHLGRFVCGRGNGGCGWSGGAGAPLAQPRGPPGGRKPGRPLPPPLPPARAHRRAAEPARSSRPGRPG